MSTHKYLAQAEPLLRVIADQAKKNDQQVWLVGGTLRDILRNEEPPDIDLAADKDAMSLGQKAARRFNAKYIPLKKEFKTCRLVANGLQVDLAGLRALDLEGDLSARDFTINAMALSLDDYLNNKIDLIDPLGGQKDLKAKELKLCGPNVLFDDPLRVLRAFRFMATHEMGMGSGLKRELKKASNSLLSVPKERICHEWLLLMAGKRVAEAVKAMDETGVLTKLIPELEQGRGKTQNPYHHLDVLEHNLACLEAMEQIQKSPDQFMGRHAKDISNYATQGPRQRALLFTAALMHDIGKPATRKETGPGWATFYYHDKKGAQLAKKACKDVGFSNADTDYVSHLISEHMRPFQLMGASIRGSLTPKAIRRLLAAIGEDLPGLFMMAMADTLAGKGPERPPEAEERLLELYDYTIKLRDEYLAQALAAPALVNGYEVMKALGIGSGRELGGILKAIREAQLDNEIKTREQALELAGKLFEANLKVD